MAGQRAMASGRFSPDDRPVPIMRDSKIDFSASQRRSLDKVFVMDFDDHATPDGAPYYYKRFFCWRLNKRHWIAAVVGSLVLVLLTVLLVIFFAVVPSIFQSNVDKVQLSINYMDIKSMTTDAKGVNKMDVELSVRVAVDATVASTMDAADATLYYQDKPFSTVTLPAQSLEKGANAFDLVLRNQAEISDVDVFRGLSKALITEQSVAVDARARVKAHAMGLSYSDLKLERTFAIKAFNQFRDPKPEFNEIMLSACTTSAYTMRINMTLDNVAQVGIGGIGALNMSVYYQQSYLGQAVSTDATLGLPRGATPMVLELTISKSLTVLPSMVAMLKGMLAMNAQFYATGDHPYATQAVLLKDAFAELNMSMPYVDGLKKVTLNPKCDILSLLTAATAGSTTDPTRAASASAA